MNDTLKLPRTLAMRLRKVSLSQGDSPDTIAQYAIAEHLRYLEWKERAIAQGDADVAAGQLVTTDKVLAAIAKQRAGRAGRSR